MLNDNTIVDDRYRRKRSCRQGCKNTGSLGLELMFRSGFFQVLSAIPFAAVFF